MTNPDISAFGSLAPLLVVENVRQAVEFYTRVLGFTHVASDSDGGAPLRRAELVFPVGVDNNRQPRAAFMVMLAAADGIESPDKTWMRNALAGPRGRGVVHWVYVDDVDAFEVAVRAAGGTVVEALSERTEGERCFTVADPDGHRWTFASSS